MRCPIPSKTDVIGTLVGVVLAASTAAADPLVPKPVSSQPIADVQPLKAGSTDPIPQVWGDSTPEVLRPMLRPYLASSDPEQINRWAPVIQRMLTAKTDAPTDPDRAARLQRLRAQALYRLSAIEDLGQLLRVVPARDHQDLVEVAADVALLQNDLKTACAYANGLAAGRDLPYWLKLRAVCAVWAKNESAGMALSLVEGQGLRDEGFLSALEAVKDGTGGATLTVRYALDYAAARLWGRWDLTQVQSRQPHVWAAVARTEAAPWDLRLKAVEQARHVMPASEVWRVVAAGLERDHTPTGDLAAMVDMHRVALGAQAPDVALALEAMVKRLQTYSDVEIARQVLALHAAAVRAAVPLITDTALQDQVRYVAGLEGELQAPRYRLMRALMNADAAATKRAAVAMAESLSTKHLVTLVALGMPASESLWARLDGQTTAALPAADMLKFEQALAAGNTLEAVLRGVDLSRDEATVHHYRLMQTLVRLGLTAELRDQLLADLWAAR